MLQYDNVLKDNRMNEVIKALDGGTGNAVLEIWTANYGTLLVSITLAKPSFTEASQQITLAGVPVSGVAVADGTAGSARYKDSAGTAWITGLTVGTGGTDIVLSSTSITTGQTITITSAVITHS